MIFFICIVDISKQIFCVLKFTFIYKVAETIDTALLIEVVRKTLAVYPLPRHDIYACIYKEGRGARMGSSPPCQELLCACIVDSVNLTLN